MRARGRIEQQRSGVLFSAPARARGLASSARDGEKPYHDEAEQDPVPPSNPFSEREHDPLKNPALFHFKNPGAGKRPLHGPSITDFPKEPPPPEPPQAERSSPSNLSPAVPSRKNVNDADAEQGDQAGEAIVTNSTTKAACPPAPPAVLYPGGAAPRRAGAVPPPMMLGGSIFTNTNSTTTAALRPNPPAFFYPGGLSTSSTPAQALPVCVSPGLAKLDFVSRGLASISYLGEGSFAKVYKVDRADEKTVTAFKVFGEKGGSWQAEFLDEWELLEALSTGCWCLSGDWCVSLCASPGWRSRSTSYGT